MSFIFIYPILQWRNGLARGTYKSVLVSYAEGVSSNLTWGRKSNLLYVHTYSTQPKLHIKSLLRDGKYDNVVIFS